MYLNAYQKYIEELIDEYGALLESQLRAMVNARFAMSFKSLNAYIRQMCIFSDYETEQIRNDLIVMHKGTVPDHDIIRSFEVMLKFIPNIIAHNAGSGYVSIRFFVSKDGSNKEICVVPVRDGCERAISTYADDKFRNADIVIFLLDHKEQMKKINTQCNCRYAIVTESGAVFFKK